MRAGCWFHGSIYLSYNLKVKETTKADTLSSQTPRARAQGTNQIKRPPLVPLPLARALVCPKGSAVSKGTQISSHAICAGTPEFWDHGLKHES